MQLEARVQHLAERVREIALQRRARVGQALVLLQPALILHRFFAAMRDFLVPVRYETDSNKKAQGKKAFFSERG